jgi:hypothetical protein
MIHRAARVIVKLTLEADAIRHGSDKKDARLRRIGWRQMPCDLDASALRDLFWRA